MSNQITKIIDIPFKTINLPSKIAIDNDEVQSIIKVEFHGTQRDLLKINYTNIFSFIDLKNAKIEKPKYYPVEIMGKIPNNIKIQLTPSRMFMRFSKNRSKTIEVIPLFTDTAPNNIIITKKIINPRFTKISGPEKEVNETRLFTKPIDLSKISSDTKLDVTLVENYSDKIQINKKEYTLYIFTTSRYKTENFIGQFKIYTSNLAPKLSIVSEQLENKNVLIKKIEKFTANVIEQSDLKIEESEIQFFLDLQLIESAGEYKLPIKIFNTNESISVISVFPKELNISVTNN